MITQVQFIMIANRSLSEHLPEGFCNQCEDGKVIVTLNTNVEIHHVYKNNDEVTINFIHGETVDTYVINTKERFNTILDGFAPFYSQELSEYCKDIGLMKK